MISNKPSFTFFLVLFANFWIWKVFSLNPIIALFLIGVTWFFYQSLVKEKLTKAFLLAFLLLNIFQIGNSNPRPLTYLSEIEKVSQQKRLNSYPYLSFPLAHWLESRPETVAFWKVLENSGSIVNPNLYFFSNAPRPRVGIDEFEKFPFILMPFFVFGLFVSLKKFSNKLVFMSFSVPLTLLSLVGDTSPFGPLPLFPLICVLTTIGLESSNYKIGRIALFLLPITFIQQIAYESF